MAAAVAAGEGEPGALPATAAREAAEREASDSLEEAEATRLLEELASASTGKWQARRRALAALGDLARGGLDPALLERIALDVATHAVRDGDLDVRLAARGVLRQLQSGALEAAMPVLLQAASSRDRRTREEARRTLRELRASPAEPCTAAAAFSEPVVAGDHDGTPCGEEPSSPLRKRWGTTSSAASTRLPDDGASCAGSCDTLGEDPFGLGLWASDAESCASGAAAPSELLALKLLQALRSIPGEAVGDFVRELGHGDREHATAALLGALGEDVDHRVRAGAAQALGRLGRSGGIQPEASCSRSDVLSALDTARRRDEHFLVREAALGAAWASEGSSSWDVAAALRVA